MNLGQMVQKKLQEQNQANVIPTLENPRQKSLLDNVVQNNTPQTIAPQNQPITDYNSYIADAQRQLNEVGKTEGEVKALNDYLSNLQAMQQYVDNQRAEEQRKAQEEQRKQQIAVQKQKEQTQKQAQKSKYEQMIEEAKAFGKQSLDNAKKDDTLASHGYSLSPNEQRDYERAMSAQANAQKKATQTNYNKVNTAMKQIANSTKASRDKAEYEKKIENTQNAFNTVSDVLDSMTKPTSNDVANTVLNLANPGATITNGLKKATDVAKNVVVNKQINEANKQIEKDSIINKSKAIDTWVRDDYAMDEAEVEKAKEYIKEYDMTSKNTNAYNLTPEEEAEAENIKVLRDKVRNIKKANKVANQINLDNEYSNANSEEFIDKWLDPTYKLNDAEVKKAKELIKDYDAKEFNRNKAINEMPSGLSSNEQRDYLRGNNAYDSFDMTKINQLRNKVNGANALANGLMEVTPGVNIVPAIQTLLNPENGKAFDEVKAEQEQANAQNPLAYYGGMIGGGLAYSLAGQQMLKDTAYGDMITKLGGGNGASNSSLRKIAADSLADAPIDWLTDTIPHLTSDIASGKSAKETLKNLATNVAFNTAINTGASMLGNIDELSGAKRELDAYYNNGKNKIQNVVNELNGTNARNRYIDSILANTDDVSTIPTLNGQSADDLLRANGLDNFIMGDNGETTLYSMLHPKSNGEIDKVINNQYLKSLFEEKYGVSLSGSKSEQRKAIREILAQDEQNNLVSDIMANTDDSVIPTVRNFTDNSYDEFMKAQQGLNPLANGNEEEINMLLERRNQLKQTLDDEVIRRNGADLNIVNDDTNAISNEIDAIDNQLRNYGVKTEAPKPIQNEIPTPSASKQRSVDEMLAERGLKRDANGNVISMDSTDEIQGTLNNKEIDEVLNSEPQVNTPNTEAPKETYTREPDRGIYNTDITADDIENSEISEEAKAIYYSDYITKWENLINDVGEYKREFQNYLSAFGIDETGVDGAEASRLVDDYVGGMEALKSAETPKAVNDAYAKIDKACADLDKFLQGRQITQEVEDIDAREAFNDVMSYIKGKTIYIGSNSKGEFPDGVFSMNKFGKNVKFTTDPTKGVSLDDMPEVKEVLSKYADIDGNAINDNRKLYDFLVENKNPQKRINYVDYDPDVVIGLAENGDNLRATKLRQLGFDTDGTKLKTSKVFNTGSKQGMTDVEFAKNYKVDDFQYRTSTEKKSMQSALRNVNTKKTDDLIKELDNIDDWDSVNTDTAMLMHKRFVEEAQALENEGKSEEAKEIWANANQMLRRVQNQLTRQGQSIQAMSKWSRNTPEGQLMQTLAEVRKQVDKKIKSNGYSATIDFVGDEIRKIMNSSATSQEAAEKVKHLLDTKLQFFADKIFGETNHGVQMSFAKGRDGVIKAITRNESVDEVISRLKKANGVADLSAKDEADIFTLLNKAVNYTEGSREWREARAEAMKIMQKSMPSSFMDKAKSVLYDNMLASLKTTITRNFGSNVLYNSLEDATKWEKALIDRAVSGVTKTRSHLSTVDSAIAGAKGLKEGAKDTALDFIKGIHTTRSGEESLDKALQTAQEVFKRNNKSQVANAIENVFYAYDKLVGGAMELGDRPIYEKTYKATKAELEKLVQKYGSDGIRKGIENANQLTDDDIIKLISRNEALRSVMQNKSTATETTEALKQSFGKAWKTVTGSDKNLLGQATMPFTQVPGNMLDRMIEYTPGLGMIRNVVRSVGEKATTGSVNQRRFVDELTHQINGSAMTYGALRLAEEGKISGAYSDDADKKKIQQANDYQEYALQNIPYLKNGEQLDINDVPVIGPMLVSGRKLYDAINDANGYDVDENGNIVGVNKNAAKAIIPGLLGTVSANMQDSLYQGISRMFGTDNRYSGSQDLVGNAKNTVKSSSNQLIPSFVRQIAQYNDPYKRDLGEYGTNEYYANLFNNSLPGNWELSQMIPQLEGVPVLGNIKGREAMPIKIGTDGQPVLQNGDTTGLERAIDTFVAPYKISKPHYTETYKEAERLEKALGDKGAYTTVLGKDALTDTKGYDVDNYKYEDLYNMRKEYYQNVEKAKTDIYNSSLYQSLSDEDKLKVSKEIDSAYKAIAKTNVPGSEYTTKDTLAKAIMSNQSVTNYFKDYFANKEKQANADELGISVSKYDKASQIFTSESDLSKYSNWQNSMNDKKIGDKINSLNSTQMSNSEKGKYLGAEYGDYLDTNTKAGKAFEQGGWDGYYLQKSINANDVKDYNGDGKRNYYDYMQYVYSVGYSGATAKQYATMLNELAHPKKK